MRDRPDPLAIFGAVVGWVAIITTACMGEAGYSMQKRVPVDNVTATQAAELHLSQRLERIEQQQNTIARKLGVIP